MTLRSAWPELLAVSAFGSRMQGNATTDSDLDMAVLLLGYAAPLALWELANPLSESVGCAVDLLGVAKAREEYAAAGPDFAGNFSRQDAAILNIQRTCGAALDLGQH